MKAMVRIVLGLVAMVGLMAAVHAADKDAKPEKLKGTFVCTKCELGETDDCANAIKVKVDDKDVIYYLKDKGKKEKYHGKFCQAPKMGSVTGVVSEKDKKKYITPGKDGVKFE